LISMFNNRVVEHIAGEGKCGLDERSGALYIPRHGGRREMVGTLDVVLEFLARHSTTSALQAMSISGSIHEEEDP